MIARGLRVESVIPPSAGDTYYLGRLGVSPSLCGKGFGSTLVDHVLAAMPVGAAGPVILDVALTNPDAQRPGFAVIGERRSTLANPRARCRISDACSGMRLAESEDVKYADHRQYGQHEQDHEAGKQQLGDGGGGPGNPAEA